MRRALSISGPGRWRQVWRVTIDPTRRCLGQTLRQLGLAALVFSGFVTLSTVAMAEADGPDAWDVVNVEAPDVLGLHAEPSARSPVVAGIPAGTRGLKNLGCTGIPSFRQWMEMSAAERERSSRARWCRISHGGVTGWVAGRFLAESSAAGSNVGPWTIVCRQKGPCGLEQTGLGGTRRTRIRIEPTADRNGEITILRADLPRQGVLSIHMDGKLISSGPIAPLKSADGRRLTLSPDDISAGLIRDMARHRTMVLSFPGEARGVEFHLERLSDALSRISRR